MQEFTQEIQNWIDDGNVVKIGENSYIEQTTQWKKIFTKQELIKFFNKEFLES